MKRRFDLAVTAVALASALSLGFTLQVHARSAGNVPGATEFSAQVSQSDQSRRKSGVQQHRVQHPRMQQRTIQQPRIQQPRMSQQPKLQQQRTIQQRRLTQPGQPSIQQRRLTQQPQLQRPRTQQPQVMQQRRLSQPKQFGNVRIRDARNVRVAGRNYSIWRGGHRVHRHGHWRTFVALSALSAIALGSAYYYPYAYIDAPAPYCDGLTEDGCQLQWEAVPTVEGPTEFACVAYCPWR